jgi:hypothetical protein
MKRFFCSGSSRAWLRNTTSSFHLRLICTGKSIGKVTISVVGQLHSVERTRGHKMKTHDGLNVAKLTVTVTLAEFSSIIARGLFLMALSRFTRCSISMSSWTLRACACSRSALILASSACSSASSSSSSSDSSLRKHATEDINKLHGLQLTIRQQVYLDESNPSSDPLSTSESSNFFKIASSASGLFLISKGTSTFLSSCRIIAIALFFWDKCSCSFLSRSCRRSRFLTSSSVDCPSWRNLSFV